MKIFKDTEKEEVFRNVYIIDTDGAKEPCYILFCSLSKEETQKIVELVNKHSLIEDISFEESFEILKKEYGWLNLKLVDYPETLWI